MRKLAGLFRDSTTLIAWLSLCVALMGGLPGLISIKKEFFGTSVDVAYDKNRSFLAQLASDHKERFGKKVIGFYGIRFVGTRDFPLTIKNVQFYVRMGWRWVEGERIDLYTNYFGPQGSVLVSGNTKDNLMLVGWVNFKPFGGDYYIERGKTVPFNIAFMFDLPEREIANSTQWKFTVTDYADKKYTTTIDHPELTFLSSTNTVVFDCYVKTSDDVQELLKDRTLSYKKIQRFLTSKYRYKPSWYD